MRGRGQERVGKEEGRGGGERMAAKNKANPLRKKKGITQRDYISKYTYIKLL